MHDLNLLVLSCFPSDDKIANISVQAAQEAKSLISLLGIVPETVKSLGTNTRLPSVDALYPDEFFDILMEEGDDSGFSAASELARLVHLYEDSAEELCTEQKDRLQELVHASIAVQVDEQVRIQSLPEITNEMEDEFIASDQKTINACLADLLERVQLSDLTDHSILRSTFSIDDPDHTDVNLQLLVSLRESHQTHIAAKAIRTHGKARETATISKSQLSDDSMTKQILRAFHDELKKGQVRGLTTGHDRQMRWYESAPTIDALGTSVNIAANGNTANTQVVANRVATSVSAKRRKIILTHGFHIDLNTVLLEARVTSLAPLKIGSWGFVYMEQSNKVMLCQVVAMYSRTGGKNGKLVSVTRTTSISSVSRVAVQVFERATGNQFRIIPSMTDPFFTKGYLILPSEAFLTTLSADTFDGAQLGTFKCLNSVDCTVYKSLDAVRAKLKQVMVEHRKHKQNATADDD
ncbi:hypothetical protein VKT23_013816 [Stygiomarasmius scandens]|uniref:Uncharacterized protein n=1 Tax=Marasmiellus scandens TaxID=2682957 RepID=A0ABR1J1X2_9AGAR